MKTFFLTLVIALAATHVQANSGNFAYVDILGVQPMQMQPGDRIEIDGPGTNGLFDVLSFNPAEQTGSLRFVSGSYYVTLSCTKYMAPYWDPDRCTIYLSRFRGMPDMDTEEFTRPPKPGMTVSGFHGVQGIDFYGFSRRPQTGTLLNLYGKNAWILNQILNGRDLVFGDGRTQLSIRCRQSYQRPAGNYEHRHDYMCSFTVRI